MNHDREIEASRLSVEDETSYFAQILYYTCGQDRRFSLSYTLRAI